MCAICQNLIRCAICVRSIGMNLESLVPVARFVGNMGLRSEQLQTMELILKQHEIVEAETCVPLFSW